MKALTLASVVLVSAASPLAATEAIQSVVGGTGGAVFPGGGAGFAFKPATNLYISALGYIFATNSTGSPIGLTSATVELLDSRGALLASVTVTTNSPPTSDRSYEAIPAIFVPANSTNYIVAYDPVEYAADTNRAWSGPYVEAIPGTNWFEVAPELLYLGATQETDIIPGPLFYPIGANFQFTDVLSAPALRISSTRTNTVVLSWPTQAVSFRLQSTTNLLAWPATSLTNQPAVAGTNNVLILPRGQTGTFFRLVQ